jgi:hypothetical protein
MIHIWLMVLLRCKLSWKGAAELRSVCQSSSTTWKNEERNNRNCLGWSIRDTHIYVCKWYTFTYKINTCKARRNYHNWETKQMQLRIMTSKDLISGNTEQNMVIDTYNWAYYVTDSILSPFDGFCDQHQSKLFLFLVSHNLIRKSTLAESSNVFQIEIQKLLQNR